MKSKKGSARCQNQEFAVPQQQQNRISPIFPHYCNHVKIAILYDFNFKGYTKYVLYNYLLCVGTCL